MNMRLSSLALVLFLALHGPAAAQDFGAFSMDVPEDWTASPVEGGAVAVIAPKNEAAITISAEKLELIEAYSPKQFAKLLSGKLDGSKPQKTADDEYTFTFVRNGVTNRVICRARKGLAMLIFIDNETGKHQQTIESMLKSLKEK